MALVFLNVTLFAMTLASRRAISMYGSLDLYPLPPMCSSSLCVAPSLRLNSERDKNPSKVLFLSVCVLLRFFPPSKRALITHHCLRISPALSLCICGVKSPQKLREIRTLKGFVLTVSLSFSVRFPLIRPPLPFALLV